MTEIKHCVNPDALNVHVDFNIRQHPGLQILIEQIHGVEDIMFWGLHKYEFLVVKGACFSRDEIAKAIQAKIREYVNL